MDEAQELIERGRTARNAGNLVDALKLYQEAAELLRQRDQPLRLAHTIRHVADIQTHMRLFEEAQANYAEALTVYRSNPETAKLDLSNTLRGYALLAQSTNDNESAHAMWAEARDLYRAMDVKAGVEEAERHLRHLDVPTRSFLAERKI